MFFLLLTLLSFLGFATSTYALRLTEYPKTVISCKDDKSACNLADINYTIKYEPADITPAIYVLHLMGDLEEWPAAYYKNPGPDGRAKYAFSRIKLKKNVNYWVAKTGEYIWSGVDGGDFIFGSFALEIEDGSKVNATEVLTMTYRDETYSKGSPTPASFPTPTTAPIMQHSMYYGVDMKTITQGSTTIPVQTSSTSGPLVVPSATSAITNDSPVTNDSGPAMSTGAKAGIGVGASLGVIAVAVGAFLFARRRYMAKSGGSGGGGGEGTHGKQELDGDATEIYPKIPMQEMSAEKGAYELEHVQDPIEMDNSSVYKFSRPISPQEMWGSFPNEKSN